MSAYQPAYRRPIATIFRATGRGFVGLCIKWGVHANVVSLLSVASATGAAACFWQSGRWPFLLIPAAGLCYLRLWFNMLDGMVALQSGEASPRGELFNELPDRVSDVLIFCGVAHSGWCHPLLGYWMAILSLVVAYIGTLGQAVGARREFSGVMAKPWRMVGLHLGSWVMLGALWCGSSARLWNLTILDWTLIAMMLGCGQTVMARLARIWKALGTKTVSAEHRHVD